LFPAVVQAPKPALSLNGDFVHSKTAQWIPVKNPVSRRATRAQQQQHQ
jgi:hypothetical protein